MIMAIHKKDRSFDRIFEQVTLDKIPMDYIHFVQINFEDGSTIELSTSDIQHLSDPSEISGTQERTDIKDINISLDYERIKSDISFNVKKVLNKFFT